jgi:tRNA dimethylallyltransferase
MSPRAFLIAGPTASGKTALAIEIAEHVGGAVVNADSMQVYRDFRILTARPAPQDEARAPHYLFGHVDAAVNYSVGRWLADFAATLAELDAHGLVPVVVGGTGMYFKAAVHGLSSIPPVPDAVREAVRAAAMGKTPQQLHAELSACDPQTANRLRPTDPQRILRALEVFGATGKPLAVYQASREPPLLDISACRCVFLAPPRAALYARIDQRYENMIAAGALDEVEALRGRGLDPALPAMRAHGAPHLMAFLNGETCLAEAIERGKSDTRHYARRQFTFARHQLKEFDWRTPDAAFTHLCAGL